MTRREAGPRLLYAFAATAGWASVAAFGAAGFVVLVPTPRTRRG